MRQKRRIQGPDGRQIECEEIGFRANSENWNDYLLDDGSVVRVKLVVTRVMRMEGESDPLGQPVYTVESTNVMSVSATSGEGEQR